MIYVGANDGMLHAFNSTTGKEEWAFVPPFIASSIPTMVNVNLNRSGVGGSNAIFGVDGHRHRRLHWIHQHHFCLG